MKLGLLGQEHMARVFGELWMGASETCNAWDISMVMLFGSRVSPPVCDAAMLRIVAQPQILSCRPEI